VRVIVVDDSKTMRKILKSILTELRYTKVEEAGNDGGGSGVVTGRGRSRFGGRTAGSHFTLRSRN
jgi:hypothetical protein